MKAEINEKGKLSVIPENELEQFALNIWAKDYFELPQNKEDRFAVLEICRLEKAKQFKG